MKATRVNRSSGVIFLTMVLLMALISLIAISSMRMAMLQSRASDSFNNHVQALQAAEIAIRYCDDIVRDKIAAALATPAKPGVTAPAVVTTMLPDPLTDISRWTPGATGSVLIPFVEHALAVAPQCLIDESPKQFVVTTRGFSPNYVRPDRSSPGKATLAGGTATTKAGEFDGAEVWLQSVTMKPVAGALAATGAGPKNLNHSWRQILAFPS